MHGCNSARCFSFTDTHVVSTPSSIMQAGTRGFSHIPQDHKQQQQTRIRPRPAPVMIPGMKGLATLTHVDGGKGQPNMVDVGGKVRGVCVVCVVSLIDRSIESPPPPPKQPTTAFHPISPPSLPPHPQPPTQYTTPVGCDEARGPCPLPRGAAPRGDGRPPAGGGAGQEGGAGEEGPSLRHRHRCVRALIERWVFVHRTRLCLGSLYWLPR